RSRVRELLETRALPSAGGAELVWPASQARRRETALLSYGEQDVPWLVSQCDVAFTVEGLPTKDEAPRHGVPTLENAVAYVGELQERLTAALPKVPQGSEQAVAIE